MKTAKNQPLKEQADRQPLETPTQRKMHGEHQSDFGREHFHGERQIDLDDQPGDLQEETLDRDAPFNKTYGLK